MNILWAALVVLVVTAAAVAAMLAVRRRAPAGSFFSDGDRASGVFGVLATGFSVLLGFLIFLAFESYDASRTGAETEAIALVQQLETAQLLDPGVSADITSELICYARWVIQGEWALMEDGELDEQINPWGGALFRSIEELEPATASEEAAFGKWLDQTSEREAARQDRIHGATGIIPLPLWLVLFFISGVIFVYLLFFADSAERAVTQGLLMGSVVAVITSMMFLLRFLDNPVHGGVGGLQPVAMERTLEIIDEELAFTGLELSIPCDDTGVAS